MLALTHDEGNNSMGMSNQQREVLELLHNYGYSLARQRKHRIYKHASGRIWVCPNTPSDSRSWNNNLARLKKSINYGLANGILQPPTTRQPMSPELQKASSNLLVIPTTNINAIYEAKRPVPQTQTPIPLPERKRPKPPHLVSINVINDVLNKIIAGSFGYFKFTEDHVLTIVDPDKREYLLSLGDTVNWKFDRASRSAADRLTNIVRDIRKNRRTKKRRVRSQLYEKFHAIFEGDPLLEANLEVNPEFSTYRFVLNLTEICMSYWGTLHKLSRAVHIKQQGKAFTYGYWEPEPGDREHAA
jgi:predicted RNA binding protein YcfA (HicA-like mRNA interferase family)